MVDRYDSNGDNHIDGPHVSYKDYAKLEAEGINNEKRATSRKKASFKLNNKSK